MKNLYQKVICALALSSTIVCSLNASTIKTTSVPDVQKANTQLAKIDTSKWITTTYKNPVNINNTLYVPESFILKAFNAKNSNGIRTVDKVIWLSDSQNPFINQPQVNWRFTGDTSITTRKINGTTYYPIAFMCKNLNADLTYDVKTKTLKVVYKGIEDIPLTNERIHTIKGYVLHQDGSPAVNVPVSFMPVSEDGALWGENYYGKYNLPKIADVYTDEKGYYEFKDINLDNFPYGGISASDYSGTIKYTSRPGSEANPSMYNNVPQVPMSPLKYNLRRLQIPTIYLHKDIWYEQ